MITEAMITVRASEWQKYLLSYSIYGNLTTHIGFFPPNKMIAYGGTRYEIIISDEIEFSSNIRRPVCVEKNVIISHKNDVRDDFVFPIWIEDNGDLFYRNTYGNMIRCSESHQLYAGRGETICEIPSVSLIAALKAISLTDVARYKRRSRWMVPADMSPRIWFRFSANTLNIISSIGDLRREATFTVDYTSMPLGFNVFDAKEQSVSKQISKILKGDTIIVSLADDDVIFTSNCGGFLCSIIIQRGNIPPIVPGVYQGSSYHTNTTTTLNVVYFNILTLSPSVEIVKNINNIQILEHTHLTKRTSNQRSSQKNGHLYVTMPSNLLPIRIGKYVPKNSICSIPIKYMKSARASLVIDNNGSGFELCQQFTSRGMIIKTTVPFVRTDGLDSPILKHPIIEDFRQGSEIIRHPKADFVRLSESLVYGLSAEGRKIVLDCIDSQSDVVCYRGRLTNDNNLVMALSPGLDYANRNCGERVVVICEHVFGPGKMVLF